jgi:hypothetical protein
MNGNPTTQKKPDVFGIFAEADGFERPLIMLDISFGRLMEEIVLPFRSDEPFFIDGVPLKKENLRKLKILQLGDRFEYDFHTFNLQLKSSNDKISRVFGDQYNVRLEALFRENGKDVTSQIVTAFDKKIKPSLKDYLPKREELIKGALTFFLTNVTQLAGVTPA